MSRGVTNLTLDRARQVYTDRLRTSVEVVADGVVQESALRHVWELHSGCWEVQHFARTVLTVDRQPWAALLDAGSLLCILLADDLQCLELYLQSRSP